MDFVVDAVRRVAGLELVDEVGFATDGSQSWHPVEVRHQLVGHRSGLDVTGPTHHCRHAESAFPVGVLLRPERSHGSVRPSVHVRSVVRGVDDDGVVGDAHVVERLEQGADSVVVLDHAVDIFAVPVCVAATVFGSDMRPEVHARRVEPRKERLARFVLPLHEVDRGPRGFIIDRLHALLGERAGILDLLLADLAEARIDRRIVGVGRPSVKHAARPELLQVFRILRIIGQLRLLLGVEVIEVAEELVEAIDCRQALVPVADMVLAELSSGIAKVLHDPAD